MIDTNTCNNNINIKGITPKILNEPIIWHITAHTINEKDEKNIEYENLHATDIDNTHNNWDNKINNVNAYMTPELSDMANAKRPDENR